MSEPTSYRLYLGRKTLGAPNWHVETPSGVQEAHHVVIHGVCNTGHRADAPNYPFDVRGRGRLTRTTIDGHVTVDIWDSEAHADG